MKRIFLMFQCWAIITIQQNKNRKTENTTIMNTVRCQSKHHSRLSPWRSTDSSDWQKAGNTSLSSVTTSTFSFTAATDTENNNRVYHYGIVWWKSRISLWESPDLHGNWAPYMGFPQLFIFSFILLGSTINYVKQNFNLELNVERLS